MEKALAVESISMLEKYFSGDFSRVYFGSETCERKIPSITEVKQAMAFCKEHNAKFSLLSPFCTDAGIERLKEILPLLSAEDELVANDWGVLHAAKQCNAQKVAGRLLNKQFRDPRIASFSGRLPPDAMQHLSLSHAAVPGFREILSSFNVKRFELDNLPQGIGTSLKNSGFSASLYFPFVFVSATRMCLCANAGKISESRKIGIFACGRECMNYGFALSNKSFPSLLFIFGNALFFENSALPSEQELATKGIDRLVANKAMLHLR